MWSRTAPLCGPSEWRLNARRDRAMRTPGGHIQALTQPRQSPKPSSWMANPASPGTPLGLLYFNPFSPPAPSYRPSNTLEYSPLTKIKLKMLQITPPSTCFLLSFPSSLMSLLLPPCCLPSILPTHITFYTWASTATEVVLGNSSLISRRPHSPAPSHFPFHSSCLR